MRHFKLNPAEERTICVDFTNKLAITAGTPETLSGGTPAIAKVSWPDSGPTLGSPAVNAAIVVDSSTQPGAAVPINQGVQFTVTGGTPNTSYQIRVTCTTTVSPNNPGQTISIDVQD